MKNIINKRMEEHAEVLALVRSGDLPEKTAVAAKIIADAISNGHKVLFCGNGGSAADSQHLAAELSGRFQKERRALPGIALTVDTSVLTAVANDYGYEKVFARQVEALGDEGDVLVGISTSGNSANVLEAVISARKKGMYVVGMTAFGGGKLSEMADVCLSVPVKNTARAQEMHILLGHILCELAELDF